MGYRSGAALQARGGHHPRRRAGATCWCGSRTRSGVSVVTRDGAADVPPRAAAGHLHTVLDALDAAAARRRNGPVRRGRPPGRAGAARGQLVVVFSDLFDDRRGRAAAASSPCGPGGTTWPSSTCSTRRSWSSPSTTPRSSSRMEDERRIEVNAARDPRELPGGVPRLPRPHPRRRAPRRTWTTTWCAPTSRWTRCCCASSGGGSGGRRDLRAALAAAGRAGGAHPAAGPPLRPAEAAAPPVRRHRLRAPEPAAHRLAAEAEAAAPLHPAHAHPPRHPARAGAARAPSAAAPRCRGRAGPAATAVVLDAALAMRFVGRAEPLREGADRGARARSPDSRPGGPGHRAALRPRRDAAHRARARPARGPRDAGPDGPAWSTADLGRCLEVAARALEESPTAGKRIVVVSAFTAGSLRLEAPLPTLRGPGRQADPSRDGAARRGARAEGAPQPRPRRPQGRARAAGGRPVGPGQLHGAELRPTCRRRRSRRRSSSPGGWWGRASSSSPPAARRRRRSPSAPRWAARWSGAVILSPDGLAEDDRRDFVRAGAARAPGAGGGRLAAARCATGTRCSSSRRR